MQNKYWFIVINIFEILYSLRYLNASFVNEAASGSKRKLFVWVRVN